jgi:hypothetical protein
MSEVRLCTKKAGSGTKAGALDNAVLDAGFQRPPSRLNHSSNWSLQASAYCLHFAYYNFCRVHGTLRVTPAMESNLTDHVWEPAELLA